MKFYHKIKKVGNSDFFQNDFVLNKKNIIGYGHKKFGNCRALTIRAYLSSLYFFMGKTGKSDRQKLEDKCDKVFSVYIRLRDCDSDGIVVCPLCGRKGHRRESQNMHFRKRTFKKYKFDEINCHAGCEHCNVMLNGNEGMYALRMAETYGIETARMLKTDKSTYKIHTYEFEEMIQKYLKEIQRLAEEKNQVEYLPGYIVKYLSKQAFSLTQENA